MILAIVWLGFGQNVLAPQNKTGIPKRLGVLELVSSVEGAAALTAINELHGTDIQLVSAYIAEYAHTPNPYHSGDEQVTVWVGRAESGEAAAELTRRMIAGIERGEASFNNLQRLTITGQEVYQVDGPGGKHFFYHSAELEKEIVWATIEANNALPLLEQVVDTFSKE